ncbi:MAG TPA: hypothetical protein VIV55_10070 [Flavobacterium sp.]
MAKIHTVVQTTGKTNPVTANYKNCVIQTVSLVDAGATFFEFVVKNKQFYPEQNIQLTPVYAGTGTPHCIVVSQSKFTYTIRVYNIGLVALNGVLSINASVIN